MQDNFENINDPIDLNVKELFTILWNKKILIASVTLTFALISVVYSLTLPNIYKSTALLAPATSNDNLSSQLSSYSSLAGLAGISVPSGEVTKSQEAIQRMRSFEFFSKFFLPNIQLENLLAVKEWLPEQNTILYNEKKFNSKESRWVRKVNYPLKVIPSDQEAFKKYLKLVNISEDKKTSFVSVSVKHQSPFISKKWVEIIVLNINESMRDEDKRVAQNSINYLSESSKTTNFQSVRDAMSNLLENQLQTLMLASSNDDYVYKIIDSPIVAEQKIEPSRAVICILGTFLGFIFGILVVLFLHMRRSLK